MENSKIKELKEKIAALEKEAMEEYRILFVESSRELFEKYPYLERFSWTQYTPYFNDGDECTFGVNSDACDIVINGVEFEEIYLSTRIATDERTKF